MAHPASPLKEMRIHTGELPRSRSMRRQEMRADHPVAQPREANYHAAIYLLGFARYHSIVFFKPSSNVTWLFHPSSFSAFSTDSFRRG